MTDEEMDRQHLASLGDADWYLSRHDAAVVCRAIALSMPPLSWEAIKARVCSLICRLSRDGDHWMCQGSFERERRPISVAAVSYLKANASKDVLNELEVAYEVFVKHSDQNKQPWLAVKELYSLLGRGLCADRFRARMARQAKEASGNKVLESAQRSAFSSD
ncbi:hypothetical protein [Ralstonia sp. ASV6]|uniref:hypothetical protein n=1 Tax=Ralstonia sp. ASV6 TaxID=2795124 RepID=UPI0018EC983D|nr:hypothetical protein [Ralstonia sp. ASV6]